MLATPPVTPAAEDVAGHGWWPILRHPVLISSLLTAVGAAVWILVFPRIGTDLSAALARAGWAERYPGSAYLFSWYGGFSPASYSLLAPYVLAAVGTHVAMAGAAVACAALLTSLLVRHRVPRPGLAAVWVAVALWTELSAGRAAFTLGLAAALGCVVVADVGRPRTTWRLALAAVLALLACLLSPVAALFLVVAAAAFALTRRRVDGAIIAAAAALPLGAMAWFSDGGVQPIGLNWLPTLLTAAAVLIFVPRDWRMVRTATIIYAIGVILACLLPTPVGSNVVRLGQLLAGPVLIGLGSARHRRLLVAVLSATALWQLVQPVIDLSHGTAPQAAGLVQELTVLHADTARVEAVPEYGHWESFELASTVPLARGWERQLDVERNPLFYRGVFSAVAYHHWLQDNAVHYVAISTATPDAAAVAEAATVRAGQTWLVPVWRDAVWQLYRVSDAQPLASPPATIIRTTPARITLRMDRAGTTIVRVHWSPMLRSAGATVAPAGAWTSLTARSPGTFTLSAPY